MSLIPLNQSERDVPPTSPRAELVEPGHCAFARCAECDMPMAHAGASGDVIARRCEMCEARAFLRRY